MEDLRSEEHVLQVGALEKLLNQPTRYFGDEPRFVAFKELHDVAVRLVFNLRIGTPEKKVALNKLILGIHGKLLENKTRVNSSV